MDEKGRFTKGDYVASRYLCWWMIFSFLWEVAVVVAFCLGWAKKIGLWLSPVLVSFPGSIFFYPLLLLAALYVGFKPSVHLVDFLIKRKLGEVS